MNHESRAVTLLMTAALLLASPAVLAEDACVGCHEAQVTGAFVHAASNMGCESCHAGVQPGAGHGRGSGLGLATEDIPQQCGACHEAELFEGRNVHAPVAAGECLACHEVHVSSSPGLLKMAPAALCLDCHANVKQAPHVVAGFSSRGHPLGDEARLQGVQDPLRPGKPFYCGSCHEPHASESVRLVRGPGPFGCQKCHPM